MDFGKTPFYKVLFTYKVFFLVYLLFAFNAWVNAAAWMNYATYLVAGLGAILMVWVVIDYKKYRNAKYKILLLLFALSYVFSALMNIRYGYMENIQGFIWLMIPIMLLYLPSVRYDKVLMQKEFSILGSLYILICTCTNVYSLSMLIWGRMYDYVDQTGELRAVAYRWGRLWGMYDDPNYGAVMAVIAIFIALTLLMKSKNKIQKSVWIISIVVQFFYLVFSDSRTGMVSLFFGLLVYIVYVMKKRQDNRINIKTILTTLACIVITFVVILGVDYGCKKVYSLPSVQQQITLFMTGNESNKPQKQPTKTNRSKDIVDNSSNGRADIWLSGLEIAKTTPFYGTSYRNVTAYAKDQLPDTYLVSDGKDYDSMHDVVMDVLVAQGLIGLLIAGVLVIWILFDMWKAREKFCRNESVLFHMCLAILMSILGGSLFISILMYVNTPQNFWFWLVLGYFVTLLNTDDANEEQIA